MHEQRPQATRRQDLIGVLRTDWTTPERRELLVQEEREPSNALAGLLAHSVVVEEVDARASSDENSQLGNIMARLLDPAPITESFKRAIAAEVQLAHALQEPVSEAVSPERLGLTDGEGIFDPEHAKMIEADYLRGVIHALIQPLVLVPVDESGREGQPFLRRIAPHELETLSEAGAWHEEYNLIHGYLDVQLDPDELLSTAQRVHRQAEPNEQAIEWNQLLQRTVVQRSDNHLSQDTN